MKLVKSKNFDENYLSKIVRIDEFKKHPNPEVTKLKCATVDGFNIITSIDAEPGLYVYFPTLSQINTFFLSYSNLFRDKELNRDETKTGMFERTGKVKAIKLKGLISEGFIISIDVLKDYIMSVTNKEIDIVVNTEFDSVQDGNKEFWISRKYVPKYITNNRIQSKIKSIPKRLNKVIESQFRFHYTTVIYKRVPYAINPDDLIQISSKWHGTSAIFANVLCHKQLTWKEKIAKWLTGYKFDIYDNIYSSRTVIKNKYYNPNVEKGYYGCDVWAEANEIVSPLLDKGITVYAEIVGFLPNGNYIQKGYDYGCQPLKGGEDYTSEKHFKIRVYRVTYTNVDGKVMEFTPLQVKQWCDSVGLIPVTEFWTGKAADLYPDIPIDNNWSSAFIDRLSNDSRFYMEKNSPDCNNKVPHEGIVIKNLNKLGTALKLKCFAFISKTDMSEEFNIEDEA